MPTSGIEVGLCSIGKTLPAPPILSSPAVPLQSNPIHTYLIHSCRSNTRPSFAIHACFIHDTPFLSCLSVPFRALPIRPTPIPSHPLLPLKSTSFQSKAFHNGPFRSCRSLLRLSLPFQTPPSRSVPFPSCRSIPRRSAQTPSQSHPAAPVHCTPFRSSPGLADPAISDLHCRAKAKRAYYARLTLNIP